MHDLRRELLAVRRGVPMSVAILDFYRRNLTLGESERAREATRAECYYLGRQYDTLADPDDDSKPFRDRKPRVQVPLYKEAVDAIARFVWGGHCFPEPIVLATRTDEDGEPVGGDVGPILDRAQAKDLTDFVRDVVRVAHLERVVKEATRKAIITTSCAVVVCVRGGYLSARVEEGKHCTPSWSDERPGDLARLEIKYRFPKEEETAPGIFKTIEWWYRRVIDAQRDVVYREVKVTAREPEWVEDPERTIEHRLGFCPARWFRTRPDSCDEVDGLPVIDPQLYSLIDDVNYTVSQRSRAIRHVTDPQLVVTGVPDGEKAGFTVKGPGKPWFLGENGEAKFIELTGIGADAASKHADDLVKHFRAAVAYVQADPKTTSGNISGVVLEFLHAPMISLAADLRDDLGGSEGYCGLLALVLRMLCTLTERGDDVWVHGVKAACEVLRTAQKSGPWLDPRIELEWQPFFAETAADKQLKVAYTQQAVDAGLIARQTGTAHLAPIFSVADAASEQEAAEQDAEAQAEKQAQQQAAEAAAKAVEKAPAPGTVAPSIPKTDV